MGSLLIFIILLIMILAKAIKIVREDQRLAIFRLGQLFTIYNISPDSLTLGIELRRKHEKNFFVGILNHFS